MVMLHLYSYMRRGNESWTWQLSPQDVHSGLEKCSLEGGKKKREDSSEACEPIRSPPLNFPQIYSLAREICMLFTHISISTQRKPQDSEWFGQGRRYEKGSIELKSAFVCSNPICQIRSALHNNFLRFSRAAPSNVKSQGNSNGAGRVAPSFFPASQVGIHFDIHTFVIKWRMLIPLICPSRSEWHVCSEPPQNHPTQPAALQRSQPSALSPDMFQ